jgi:hypothetical protein
MEFVLRDGRHPMWRFCVDCEISCGNSDVTVGCCRDADGVRGFHVRLINGSAKFCTVEVHSPGCVVLSTARVLTAKYAAELKRKSSARHDNAELEDVLHHVNQTLNMHGCTHFIRSCHYDSDGSDLDTRVLLK